MSSVYPDQNPFPYLGTFTILGESRDLSLRTERWLPRPHIEELREALTSYAGNFRPGWSSDGRVIVIRGPHGAGKTHTIYALLRQITELRTPPEQPSPEASSKETPAGTGPNGKTILCFYTLQQDEDFLGCYRQVVAQVNKEAGLWQKLGKALLATMAAEQLGFELGTEVVENEVLAPLRVDPGRVDGLFASYTVARSVATSRQEKVLLDLTKTAFNKSLKAAIDALQGERFGQAAVRWLSLEPVPREELDAMGIARPIS